MRECRFKTAAKMEDDDIAFDDFLFAGCVRYAGRSRFISDFDLRVPTGVYVYHNIVLSLRLRYMRTAVLYTRIQSGTLCDL
jgi:hypothetical protein